jgi:hypothetical protein
MLQWCRVRAPRLAAITLVWMVAVGGVSVAPHQDDCHDAACSAIAVEHDPSAHRVGGPAVADDSHPLHCLVCHWVRAFRPHTEARFVSAPASDAGVRLPVQLFDLTGRAPVAQPPLRSPPAPPITA